METLKDYLVKISAQTEGLAEASGKLKNLTKQIMMAMIGFRSLTTVMMKVANAVKSEVKETIKLNDTLETTAKSLKKTTSEARAHQIALAAMGKTMQEINKDEELKATYDELIKIGKAFEFKEAPKGTIALKDLTKELTKLKFTAKLGLSQIYEYFKIYAAKPLEQVRGWIKDITDKVRANLGEITQKIGLFIAKAVKELLYHLQHIIGVVEQLWDWGTRLIKWISTMSSTAKTAGIAIVGVIAMIQGKLKPLHLLLTAIYLLVDDFVVWSRGGKSYFGNAWQGIIDAFETIKEFLNGDVGKLLTGGGLLALLFGTGGKNGGLFSGLFGGDGGVFGSLNSNIAQISLTLTAILAAVNIIKTIKAGTDEEVGDMTTKIFTPMIQGMNWVLNKTGLGEALGIQGVGETVEEALEHPEVKKKVGADVKRTFDRAIKAITGRDVSDYSAVARIAAGAESEFKGVNYGTEVAPGVMYYDLSGKAIPAYANGSGGGGAGDKTVNANTTVTISVQGSNAMSIAQQVSQSVASVIAQNVQGALA